MNHEHPPSESSGQLILVVDDHEDTRFMYREFLKMEGFEVAEAADGEEAVERALTLRPNLIVMDVTLPGMSGLEAAAILKADPSLWSLRIIMLTGHHLESMPPVQVNKSYDMALMKPCAPDVLIGGVRDLLRGLPKNDAGCT